MMHPGQNSKYHHRRENINLPKQTYKIQLLASLTKKRGTQQGSSLALLHVLGLVSLKFKCSPLLAKVFSYDILS